MDRLAGLTQACCKEKVEMCDGMDLYKLTLVRMQLQAPRCCQPCAHMDDLYLPGALYELHQFTRKERLQITQQSACIMLYYNPQQDESMRARAFRVRQ